jgi:hypothetical protein
MRDNLIVAEFLSSGFVRVDPNEVGRIACPTLLAPGARSPAIFHRLTDRLKELLPQAQRVRSLRPRTPCTKITLRPSTRAFWHSCPVDDDQPTPHDVLGADGNAIPSEYRKRIGRNRGCTAAK